MLYGEIFCLVLWSVMLGMDLDRGKPVQILLDVGNIAVWTCMILL